jgi:hypothetical protein
VFIQGALEAFSAVTEAIGNMLSAMADAAEALPGMDLGLSTSLRSAADSVSGLSTAAGDEAALWGQAAAENFGKGLENINNPFAAFDREFAKVKGDMEKAGAAAGKQLGDVAGKAIRASGQALQALVVGTSGGEAFRNAIARGADPRLEGDAAKETAQNTADIVEELEDLNAAVASDGGLGLATIAV